MRLKGHAGRMRTLAVLPDGRFASGGSDRANPTLCDPALGVETARLEVNEAVICVAALTDGRLVAGDALGRLHWLLLVE